jgi:hypothetical protein
MKKTYIAQFVLAFLLFGLFAGVLYFGWMEWQKQEAVKHWDQIEVDVVEIRGFKLQKTSRGHNNQVSTYKIIYRYNLDGAEHTGEGEIYPGSIAGARENAFEVGKLPAGFKATLFVNPDNPEDKTLISTSKSIVSATLMVAGVVLAAAIYLLAAAVKTRRRLSELLDDDEWP